MNTRIIVGVLPLVVACSSESGGTTTPGIQADPLDPFVGTWQMLTDEMLAGGTCPCDQAATYEASGYLIVTKTAASAGVGSFCNDTAGKDCSTTFADLAIEATASGVTMRLDVPWQAAGFDCSFAQTASAKLTLSGGTLTVEGSGIQHVTGGAECDAYEKSQQELCQTTNVYEGCGGGVERMTFEKK